MLPGHCPGNEEHRAALAEKCTKKCSLCSRLEGERGHFHQCKGRLKSNKVLQVTERGGGGGGSDGLLQLQPRGTSRWDPHECAETSLGDAEGRGWGTSVPASAPLLPPQLQGLSNIPPATQLKAAGLIFNPACAPFPLLPHTRAVCREVLKAFRSQPRCGCFLCSAATPGRGAQTQNIRRGAPSTMHLVRARGTPGGHTASLAPSHCRKKPG